MANRSKSTKTKKPIRQQARFDPQRGSRPAEMVDLIDPAWILKALGGLLLLALLCAYITMIVLFWRSQWQIVLHPSRVVARTPAALHLPFQEVHFDVNGAGQPQIDGWWIPSTSAPSAPTALLLHAADGSMADALPSAQILHDANLNVLLFDYRGYGKSSGAHPTEQSMEADSDAALTYLTSTRSTPVSSVVIYGIGAGGALAVHLAAQYPLIPAVILQTPDGDFAARAKHDPRSGLVPFGLLFNQNFALAAPLHRLKAAVLTISAGHTTTEVQQAIVDFVHTYVVSKSNPPQ